MTKVFAITEIREIKNLDKICSLLYKYAPKIYGIINELDSNDTYYEKIIPSKIWKNNIKTFIRNFKHYQIELKNQYNTDNLFSNIDSDILKLLENQSYSLYYSAIVLYSQIIISIFGNIIITTDYDNYALVKSYSAKIEGVRFLKKLKNKYFKLKKEFRNIITNFNLNGISFLELKNNNQSSLNYLIPIATKLEIIFNDLYKIQPEINNIINKIINLKPDFYNDCIDISQNDNSIYIELDNLVL